MKNEEGEGIEAPLEILPAGQEPLPPAAAPPPPPLPDFDLAQKHVLAQAVQTETIVANFGEPKLVTYLTGEILKLQFL